MLMIAAALPRFAFVTAALMAASGALGGQNAAAIMTQF
jgi:hypothetical protein